MARILRGDIWWADFEPTRGREKAGTRPVLVISQDIFNTASGTVIALAITSQSPSAGFPLTLELTDADLPKRSWVKISQVRTLSVERLSRRAGRASAAQLSQVIAGLNDSVQARVVSRLGEDLGGSKNLRGPRQGG